MRKFKVIKKWPGGPEFGTIGNLKSYNGGEVCFDEDSETWYKFEQLEGFVEEIKEPEEFWFVDAAGDAIKFNTWNGSAISKEYRFPTKESAQAFADFMKNTYGGEISFEWGCGCTTVAEDRKLAVALNSRKNAR